MKDITIIVHINARVPDNTNLGDVSVEFPGGVQVNEAIRNNDIGEYTGHSTEHVQESWD
jgi:hypothetical protein